MVEYNTKTFAKYNNITIVDSIGMTYIYIIIYIYIFN